MSQILFRSLLVVPAVLGTVLGSTAWAETSGESSTLSQVNQYANEGASLNQVRSVNQLSDVKPTDWAYQALRSLVERYGCIAGYPDGTFRGNRAMTRYEFAAGLNACLDTVNELIASATADLATQEDLLVLQRLQEEFQAELATLRGRVDALEARTSELESNQFSTTTKLAGEVLFSLQDEFGSTDDVAGDINTTFGGNATLNLYTSFTGSDKLTTRLEAENIPGSNSYGPGLITYSGTGLDFNLEYLGYTFSPTDKSTIVVGPIGIGTADFVPTVAWYGGSFFTDYFDAPTFYEQDADEIGIGGNYQFNDNFNLAAGFLSNSNNSLVGSGGGPGSGGNLDDGSNPAEGVFIDNWAAMAQLTGTVGNFQGVLAFVHEYNNADPTENFAFFDLIGTSATAPFGAGVNATSETVGLSMKYEFSPRFILQAFATHAWGDAKSGPTADAKVYSGGLGFIFPDLFREGNEGGIAVGVPPTVYDASGASAEDSDTPLAVDLYYDFAISDNITITPGGILLFNGNGSSDNDTVFVGALKTKFKF